MAATATVAAERTALARAAHAGGGGGVNIHCADSIAPEAIETLKLPDLGAHGLLHKVLPPPSLHKWDIKFPYSKRVEGLHKEFAAAAQMPPYSCVYVRRAQRLPLYPGLDRLTRGGHIRRVLARAPNAPKFVFIITDEEDRTVFAPPPRPRLAFWRRAFWRPAPWQKDPFHFVFADDYELLRRLKAEDNYLLFCVQLLIMEHAAYRVSTFKKPYAAHPHAPFHDHLAAGWEANI